jgi:hypothetical protein
VRRVSKKNSNLRAIQLREWRVTLLRYRGEFLGYVKATSREAAESEAARLFSLTEFQRRALPLLVEARELLRLGRAGMETCACEKGGGVH